MPGILTHSPADVVGSLLMDLGIGSIPGGTSPWPVYVSNEPTSPDRVITVYDTDGKRNGRVMIGGEVQEHHGIQIRIRSDTYPGGYLKSRDIAITLDETLSIPCYQRININSVEYVIFNLSRRGDVISLGKGEDSKRNLFTINYLVSLRKVS